MSLDHQKELFTRLESPLPVVSETPVEDDMTAWRNRIDAIDSLIISLLNDRAECAIAIGAIKRHLGIPIYVPSREEAVLDNVTRTNPGPLSDTAVRRLYERIIDETRSLERQLSESSHGR